MSLPHTMCRLPAPYSALTRVFHSCSSKTVMHVQNVPLPAGAVFVCSHFYHVIIYHRSKPILKGDVKQRVQHCYIIAAVNRRCKPCSLALGDQLMQPALAQIVLKREVLWCCRNQSTQRCGCHPGAFSLQDSCMYAVC